MKFRYGACVGSWANVARHIEPHLTVEYARDGHRREFVGLSGQPSLPVAHNRILDHYADEAFGDDVIDGPVVLLHDDLEITDPHFEAKAAEALATGAAIVGVAGSASEESLAWWEYSPIGHQRTDAGPLDFGQRTGEVAVLEGSILVLSPWAVKALRYDESFPGYHNADEICWAARQRGGKLLVADIDTHHHTPMGWRSEAGRASWYAGEALYRMRLATSRASKGTT